MKGSARGSLAPLGGAPGFVDVRQDHATNVALGEMALRRSQIWYIFYAVVFLGAGVALLSLSGTMRLLGVASLAVAVGILVWRVSYWKHMRASENRLAALGRMHLAVAGRHGGAGGNFRGGLGAGVGVAAGDAVFRMIGSRF